MIARFARWLREPETIGPAECPLILRWTVGGERASGWPVKLLVHRFPPNVDDRDVHDHPRPFVTLVLRGGYDDLVPSPCPECSTRVCCRDRIACAACETCGGHGGPVVLGDRMRAGMVRRRPAHHAHRTRVHAEGAWTLVLMGPVRRPWGFIRNGRWWPWKVYAATFGDGMRCP